ncbi:3-ketoacyl-CoA synthase 11 [Vitis vinifera]|uniref:3-ketoacyl-CoA synthase 11 n=1 Tax=Vitis vinifera TaxID=29760 RepID=A0A438F415_VITVI|nr:3-ketoacyl-CoA synthase 11 [Vitis vinifera]
MFLLEYISNDLLGFLISQYDFILPAAVMVGLTLIAFMLSLFAFGSSPKIFLVDFACYKPPNSLACSKEMVIERLRLHGNFSDESLEFMKKLMKASGLGEATYLSEGLLKEPLDTSTKAARKRRRWWCSELWMSYWARLGYKLSENVLSYNLSGMGCSAGLLSIGLAKTFSR